MTNVTIGLLGMTGLLFLLAIRTPIGIALGVVASIGVIAIRGWNAGLSILGASSFDFVAHWTLTAVPMFILMGNLAYHSGLTAKLFDAARVWLSFLPGGLALATVASSAGFAAASGSSVAMAGAMSRIAVPEMLRAGYDKGLATGSVAASGTLGALIPPSIPFILYAVFMEASVAKLLIAGIIPGLLTLVAYSVLIIVRTSLNPELAPAQNEVIPLGVKLRLLGRSWPLPAIVMGVVGGLYSGIFTATEVGAGGAALVLVVSLLGRAMTPEILWRSVRVTVVTTATIFLIAIGAVMFSQFLTLSRIPLEIGNFITIFADNKLMFVLLVSAFYLVLGMFLDPIGLMLVTLPILYPAISALGIDVIWFGVIVVKFVEIGLLTPPIGLNLYVVRAAVGDSVSFTEIVKGTSWFLVAESVVMVCLFAFPGLVLLLPSLM